MLFLLLILLLLALSMFGLYEIQMPSAIQSRLQQQTQGMAGGKLVMVFVLGIISALIVGACVSPIFIGALGVAIVQGDPVLGGAIMFAMAMGMGVFLVLIGVGMGSARYWVQKPLPQANSRTLLPVKSLGILSSKRY